MTPLPSDAAPTADQPPPVRCHMDALPAGYLAAAAAVPSAPAGQGRAA